jgi:hypothetical protein
MIEKVRSIAIFGPQINVLWSWPRLYRWPGRTASAPGFEASRCIGEFFEVCERRADRRMSMFRKCTLAAAAIMALLFTGLTPSRAADLAPDVVPNPGASYGQHRGVWCPRFCNGVPVSFGYGLCYQRELVATPWGPRQRLVNHCC